MVGIILDLMLCGIIYGLLLTVVLIRERRRKRDNPNEGSDDDGGLPISLPPDFDLPPGISFSDGTRGPLKKEPEEVYA